MESETHSCLVEVAEPVIMENYTPDTRPLVVFETNGGKRMNSVRVNPGTEIRTLSKPVYETVNGVRQTFLGWYYDAEFTEAAENDDLITESCTLYAATVPMEDKTPEDECNVAAADDVPTTFTITVKSSNASLTAAQVLEKLDVTNVSHAGAGENAAVNQKANNIAVTGSNGTYTISGKHYAMQTAMDGFATGESYKIELKDACLTFDGFNEYVREYNITVHMEDSNNLALADDVIPLKSTQATGLYRFVDTGDPDNDHYEAVAFLDGNLVTVNADGSKDVAQELKGYFTYSGADSDKFKPGVKVALYDNTTPEEALANPAAFEADDSSHIAYLTITKVDGNKFYFDQPEIDDILKKPEILPIAAGNDLDFDGLDDTVELFVSLFDWSDNKYAALGLDSNTTVDEGDFITFYRGTYGSTDMEQVGSFMKVVSIEKGRQATNYYGDLEDYYTIRFEEATQEDVLASGDTHYSMSADLYNSLDPASQTSLKSQIRQQFLDSGYAEQAAMYTAKAALATDKFTDLTGLARIDDYTLTFKNGLEDNEQVELMSLYSKYKEKIDNVREKSDNIKDMLGLGGDDDDEGGDVEVELTNLYPSIGTARELGSGLRVSLDIGVEIEIDVPKYEGSDNDDGDNSSDDDDDDDDDDDEENKLKIELTTSLVQEVQIELGFSAKVEWGSVGFIPYPEDIVLIPTITNGSYTNLDFNAKMYTTGGDDDDEDDEDTDEEASCEFFDITEELSSLLDSDDGVEEDSPADTATWLGSKYADMLDTNHSPVQLVDVEMFDISYELVPGIISFELKGDFVVTADVVVSLGLEFEYITSKKHVYSISLIGHSIDSETIDLIKPELDFKFYVMGSLEIRAGIELEFSLNLVEGYLGKVSLTVGAGAYTIMRGFFYYHYHWLEGAGSTTKYAGAFYIEIGVYFEVGLGASVGKEVEAGDVKIDAQLYKTEVPLYENKWPLFTYGTNEAPIDFARAEEDYSDIEMHQYTKTFVVPDSYYDVMTLSLDSGDLNAVNYNNRTSNGSSDQYYGVKVSDTRHFAYDPVNHTISVVNIGDEDGQDPLQECSCTVTFYWKNGSVPLSTACMTRTFNVLWDNYKDGYSIVPFSQGGSYVAPIIGEKGTPVETPADPTRLGYLFTGWYTDSACTSAYTFPTEMPDSDQNIYAGWNARNNIAYTVNVYTAIPEYVYDDTKGKYVLNDKYMPGYYDLTSSTTYKAGTTGANKTVTGDPIEGYTTPDSLTYKIQADGSTVYNLYYDEKEYTVTFTDPSNENKAQSFSVHKGTDIIPPVYSRLGYTQTGWKNTATGVVTSMSILKSEKKGILGVVDGAVASYSFEPEWKANTDTPYRIEYYVRQPNGQYAVKASEYRYGTTGAQIDIAEDIRYNVDTTLEIVEDDGTFVTRTGAPDTLFAVYDAKDPNLRRVDFNKATDGVDYAFSNGKATIAADGKLVIKLFYERDTYTVKVSKTDGPDDAADFGNRQVYYGGKLVLDEAVRVGYHTEGWKKENDVSDHAEARKIVKVTEDNLEYKLQGWTANTYTVKLENFTNSGESNTQNCTYGQTFALPTPHARPGYSFDGYYNAATGETYQPANGMGSSGYKKNLTAVNGGVVVLTCIWRPANKYYVTYNYNGGALRAGDSNPSYYMNDSQTASQVLSVPVKTGYDFTGWFIGDTPVAELKERVSVVTPGDITLTAGWKVHEEPIDGEDPETVTVILDYNGYYGNARYEVEYGTTYAEFLRDAGVYSTYQSNIDADGDRSYDVYELTGWYETRNGATPINQNDEITGYTVLFSRWKGGTQTISYNGLGESSASDLELPVSYKFGEGATIPAIPNRTGYTFKGWTDGESTEPVMSYVIGEDVTTAVTLTANWEKNSWDVSLYGANGIYQKIKDVEYGTAIPTHMAPVNPGYSVKDWVDKNDQTVYDTFPTAMPDKNLDLQARFEKATYTITFNSMGGSIVEPMNFTIEDSPSIWGAAQRPERDGYDFDGWYMSQGLEESKRIEMFRPMESSYTLYAKWKPHRYTVQFFDGMEEITSIAPVTVEFDVAFNLPSYTFEDSSTVSGWTDAMQAASGSGIIYKPGASVMKLASGSGVTINLYAIKEMPGYTITYMLNNGGPTDGNPNPENFIKSNRKITLEDPRANEGYYFDGWYDESGTKVTEIDCSVEGSRTLRASWIHAGTFSLTKVSSSGDLEAGTGVTTFRITRTIPEGAHADTDTHYVYYRTENGTLIGGTTADNAVNFKHVGGPEVFAVFKYGSKPYLSTKVNGNTVEGTLNDDGSGYIDFTVENERIYSTYMADMTDGGVMAQAFVWAAGGTSAAGNGTHKQLGSGSSSGSSDTTTSEISYECVVPSGTPTTYTAGTTLITGLSNYRNAMGIDSADTDDYSHLKFMGWMMTSSTGTVMLAKDTSGSKWVIPTGTTGNVMLTPLWNGKIAYAAVGSSDISSLPASYESGVTELSQVSGSTGWKITYTNPLTGKLTQVTFNYSAENTEFIIPEGVAGDIRAEALWSDSYSTITYSGGEYFTRNTAGEESERDAQWPTSYCDGKGKVYVMAATSNNLAKRFKEWKINGTALEKDDTTGAWIIPDTTTGNITLTAEWNDVDICTVTYVDVPDDIKSYLPATVVKGKTLKVGQISKSGYEFKGWKVDSNTTTVDEVNIENVQNNVTLTAVFSAIPTDASIPSGDLRYYSVVIYDVKSAEGNYEASAKSGEGRVTRSMTYDADHRVSKGTLYGATSKGLPGSKKYATESTRDSVYLSWNANTMLDKTPEQLMYMRQGGGQAQVSLSFTISPTDISGWNLSSDDPYLAYRFKFNGTTFADGKVEADEDDEYATVYDSVRPISDLFNKYYTMGGTANSRSYFCWRAWAEGFSTRVTYSDTEAPKQVGIAPGAFSRYSKGDEVRFSVVYNEIITNVQGITVDTTLLDEYLPIKDVEYVGGVGTNVLVFKGTAKRDFEYATWQGTGTNEKLMYICPVNGGTVTDIYNNEGDASTRLLEEGKKLKDLGEYVYTTR